MSELFDPLRMSLDRLQEAGRTVRIFFRNDDVDRDEGSLGRLLNLFAERAIPLNLEIIPGLLTESAAVLLRRHHRQFGDLVELDQHGWLHANHEPEGRKCEFGSSRSFDQQLADLARGRKVLEDAFEEAFSPVFTPPWNRCTTDTYRALDQLGFQVLSQRRGRAEIRGYGFREVSVTLDLGRGTRGELVTELNRQLNDPDPVGIMLHHKVMDEDAFDFLALLLDLLRLHRAVNFQTLVRGQYRER
ncbi:MAG TPA: polysaccharide deacetylase [Blastocatellia bacterium]|nr:polysaccharide deacetylase [Blastocatellia bacterium]